MNDLTTDLRAAVRAFLAQTGMAPARLGAEALGDPSFVERVRAGASPQLDTAQREPRRRGSVSRSWGRRREAGSARVGGVYRLYCQEGLQLRPRRHVSAATRQPPRTKPGAPNVAWTMDFVSDQTRDLCS